MEKLGRYQLVRQLATGGMAEVFLARVEGPGGFSKQVVIKKILSHLSDQQDFVEMFLSEARVAAHLSHPNIVQVFDFGQVDATYFLAMEYVDGPNLRTLHEQRRAHRNPLPPAACARMVSQACEGLAYAHAYKDPDSGKPLNLLHRDISPDNLIISTSGSVKVLDFGIARSDAQAHRTSPGVFKGKLAYMSPEQLRGKPLDRRTDVYALGVVLFELLTGTLPYDSDNAQTVLKELANPRPLPRLSDRLSDVAPQLDELVARAMEKDRERRCPDCKTLQEGLETFVRSTGEQWLPSDLAGLVAPTEPVELPVGGGPRPREAPQAQLGAAPTVHSRPRPAVATAEPAAMDGTTRLIPAHQPMGNERTIPVPDPRPDPVPDPVPEPVAPTVPPPSPALKVVAISLSVATVTAAAIVGFWEFSQPAPSLLVPPPAVEQFAAEAPDAAAPTLAPVDSASAPLAAPQVVAAAQPPDAGARRPARSTAPAARAEVEVRVHPRAMIYVDGQRVGRTPLADPLSLPAGHHSFRLVNERFNKDVSVDFVAQPGRSVFRYNLLQ